jgi:hypothetical protein
VTNSNLDRLSAVKLALASPTDSTQVDILVSTVQVLVHEEPRSRGELLIEVPACWPGTSLEPAETERAIDLAEELGVIAARRTAQDEPLFYPAAGDAGVEESKAWTNQVIAETRSGIKSRVSAEMMRQLTDAEVDWWMNALIEALAAGIREAFAAYQGDVSRPSRKWLIPSDFDKKAIRLSISEAAQNEAVRRLLLALATESIDSSVEFGSGIVTYLATGYILHAFLARRNLAGAIEAAGPLANQQVMLDTPVLYALLDLSGPRQELEKTLEEAAAQHMRIVLPSHCTDELQDAIKRSEQSGEAKEYGRAVSSSEDADFLRGITAGVISVWMGRASVIGSVESWPEFRRHASNLVGELGSKYGVNVVEYNRQQDRELTALSGEFGASLRNVLINRSWRGGPERGDWQISNDGRTLAMADIVRSRFAEKMGNSPWPGCWILSPDSAMGPAFDRLRPDEEHPVVLTPSQLLYLLSTFVSPPSVKELATSAARLLSHTSFMHVASRYPPSSALEMADALRGEGRGASALEQRIAQLSLREILEDQEHEQVDHGSALVRLQARRRSQLAEMQVADIVEREQRYSEEIVQLSAQLEARQEAARRTAEREETLELQRLEAESRAREMADHLKASEAALKTERASYLEEEQRRTEEIHRQEAELARGREEQEVLDRRVEQLELSLARSANARMRWMLASRGVAALLLALSLSWFLLRRVSPVLAVSAAFALSLYPLGWIAKASIPQHDYSWWPSFVASGVVAALFFALEFLF